MNDTLKKTAQRVSRCHTSRPSTVSSLLKQLNCIKLPAHIVNKLIDSEQKRGGGHDFTPLEERNLCHADQEAKKCLESQNFPVEAIRTNQTGGSKISSRATRWQLHNPKMIISRLAALADSLDQAQNHPLELHDVHLLAEIISKYTT